MSAQQDVRPALPSAVVHTFENNRVIRTHVKKSYTALGDKNIYINYERDTAYAATFSSIFRTFLHLRGDIAGWISL